MSNVRNLFRPQPMAANSSYEIGGNHMGGFLPKVSGTISVVDSHGTTLVDAVPVTAGVYVEIPIYFENGATVTLAGDAAGTLML